MNNNTSLSPAGLSLSSSLGDQAALPGESEEQRRRRLAAIEAQRQKLSATLSPAGSALAQRGYLTGLLQ